MLILQGVCSDGKLYTLLFGKENIIVGCDLDLFQSGKGLWEVIGGGEKMFVSEMQIEKY